MDKYDYITATTLEEKVRLEKLIKYMEENNIETDLLEYKERYNISLSIGSSMVLISSYKMLRYLLFVSSLNFDSSVSSNKRLSTSDSSFFLYRLSKDSFIFDYLL